MPQHIVVVEYNSIWQDLFNKEKLLIKGILGENVIEIYHIGSTAVHDLCAKPIIDIMPVVNSLEEVDLKARDFEKVGYEYLGEFGIEGRRYLRKGGDERTHQIHIFEAKDRLNIERHLAVRDYLRAHPSEALQYGELKKQLALKYPYNIDGYCDGKASFVQELEAKALSWYQKLSL